MLAVASCIVIVTVVVVAHVFMTRATRPYAVPSLTAPSATTGCDRTFRYNSESWPDCSNTGVPPGTRLIRRSGIITVHQDGTVIKDLYLTGGIDVYANNVTIEDSEILANGYIGILQRNGYHGLKVLHNTITGDVGKGPDSGGEDIGVWNIGGDIEVAYDNVSEFGGDVAIVKGTLRNSYLHDEQVFGSTGIGGCKPLPHPIGRCYNHSDAFGIDAGNDINIVHNTILESRIPGATSAVELDDDLGTISNVTVQDNFLSGGEYCTYGGSNPDAAPSTNIKYLDNAFSTLEYAHCGNYGPVAYWDRSGAGNVWSGNYWADGPYRGLRI
jgi:hypothetical protein